MQILQLPGTDKALYELVAPLVMDPKVIRWNNNFPFRTSPRFEWFVAVDEGQVLGFVTDRKADTLEQLIRYAIGHLEEGPTLAAVSFKEDRELFASLGFEDENVWTRYVRMRRKNSQNESAEERV